MLCSNLQKRNVRINGFRMNKEIPSRILASHIAKNERSFFKILQECYKPTYMNRDAAMEAFSPDTAVLGLTYFVCENITDEDFLNSLLQKTVNSSAEPVASSADSKIQKKYEEFRQKYLTAHRELEQVKKELDTEKKENQRLRELLSARETEAETLQTELHNRGIEHIELQQTRRDLEQVKKDYQDLAASLSAKDTLIVDLRAEIEAKTIHHNDEVAVLTQLISELESKNAERANVDARADRRILVLVSDETELITGADSLPFNKIPQLIEIHEDYTDILFIKNDLPFYLRRCIHKMSSVQDKLHAFATKVQLMEYIEKG